MAERLDSGYALREVRATHAKATIRERTGFVSGMAGVGIGHCREAIARRIQHPRRAGVASRVVVNPAGAPPRKRGRSCQPPWRGGGGQCACARPAGTRTPRERPRARGRPAAPRYPRRTHPATRDRFPATPAEAFRGSSRAGRRGSAAGRRRDSQVRTTLGFALGMICARMNYSTPTVVYGYAHECGMRARAPARRGASVGAQPAERPASARTSS